MHGIYLFVDGIDLISVDSINKSEFDKEMSTKKNGKFQTDMSMQWTSKDRQRTDYTKIYSFSMHVLLTSEALRERFFSQLKIALELTDFD